MSSKNGPSIAVLTATICLLVYLRALSCGFINYDDPDYILNNQAIRNLDWQFIVWAFTESYNGWWMPLTWISFAIDYHFWELNPFGYHLTNILLHAANAGMVVMLADRLYRGWLSKDVPLSGSYLYPGMLLFAGLLFGIHPLRVESVAWATERKDVLNGLFSLGALLCYLQYAVKQVEGGAEGGARRYYLLALGFFACSLMAKSVSVVLPAMMLVADWYPLGRMRPGRMKMLMMEKIPFFILSVAVAVVTIHSTSQSQYLVSYELFPFYQRLIVSGAAIVEYCRLMMVPVGIIPLFMIPDPVPASYALKAVLAGIIFCIVIYAGRKRAWIPAVWLSFLIPLLPVLAFFQNGDQAYAARFTYLSSIAPSIAAAVLVMVGYGNAAESGQRFRYLFISGMLAVLLFYAGMTLRLITVWDNTGTFWSRVIKHEPGAQAYKERGVYRYMKGDHSGAVDDFSEAIKVVTSVWRPYTYNIYAFRGEALFAAGRNVEAEQDFSIAIQMYPHPEYFHYRGLALQAQGKVREAEEDLLQGAPSTGKLEWFWEKSEK